MSIPDPAPLTVEEVGRRVGLIAAYASRQVATPAPDAWAHSAEDELHRDVLGAIAGGHPDGAALARAALRTAGIPFARWYE